MNDGPRYGWSKRGKPAFHVRCRKRGAKITLALCISMIPRNNSCLVGYALYEKSMTSIKFVDFLNVISNAWKKSTQTDAKPVHIILDNGSFHGPHGSLSNPFCPTPTVKLIQTHAKQLDIEFLYIRPLSPQFNPVEYVFSLLKRAVQKQGCHTKQELISTIRQFLENLDHQAIFNTFNHCINISTEEFERIQRLTTNSTCDNKNGILSRKNEFLDYGTQQNDENMVEQFSSFADKNEELVDTEVEISKQALPPINHPFKSLISETLYKNL